MIVDNANAFTLAQLNAYLKAHGAKSKLVRGGGYYYFVDGDAHKWASDSVYVYRCVDLTPAQWLAEYRERQGSHDAREVEASKFAPLRRYRAEEGSARDGDKFFSKKAHDFVAMNSRSEASRWTLCYMSPSEFLRMAKSPPPGGSVEKLAGVDECLRKGEQFADIPYLKIENDGGGVAHVIGHEGRHRSIALRELGVRQMPVALLCVEGGAGPTIRWGRVRDASELPRVLKGQEDHVGYSIPFPESVVFPPPRSEVASPARAAYPRFAGERRL